MIFIRLTLVNRNKEVFLNAEKINDLMLTDSKTETMVSLQGEQNFYNVVEKHEEIMKIIENEEGKYQLLCANCNWIKRFENNETRKSNE